jgi:hypothetical protein
VKRLAFVFGPLLAYAVCFAAVAAGTIVLDHDVLGRDANGWPVLYTTPALRYAVDGVHLAAVYALPSAIAIGFLSLGRRSGATSSAIAGGAIVCALGALPLIEAVWTGVKGTSGLSLDLADDWVVAAARAGASLAILAGAVLLSRR